MRLLASAIKQIPQIVRSPEFKAQMTRFIDSATVARTIATEGYADYLAMEVGGLFIQMRTALGEMAYAQKQAAPVASAAAQTVAATPVDGEAAKPKAKAKRKLDSGLGH